MPLDYLPPDMCRRRKEKLEGKALAERVDTRLWYSVDAIQGVLHLALCPYNEAVKGSERDRRGISIVVHAYQPCYNRQYF